MPCLAAKVALGASIAATGYVAVVAVEGSPTVVISAAALAGLYVTFAAMVASTIALAECLDDAGRHQDAATLRREMDEVQRQLKRLQESR